MDLPHHEGHLRGVVLLHVVVAPDRLDLLLGPFTLDDAQRQVLGLVDRYQGTRLFARHLLRMVAVAHQQRFLVVRIEELLQQSFVGWVQRTQQIFFTMQLDLLDLDLAHFRNMGRFLFLIAGYPVVFAHFTQQLIAEIGVGDLYQLQCPFADTFTAQRGYTPFGDHVVHVAARGHHTAAFGDEGDDLGLGAVFRGRRQGDDGFAALAHGRAADEIDLTADAAVEAITKRIGDDLPGQVHLDGAVDRDHVVVARDVRR